MIVKVTGAFQIFASPIFRDFQIMHPIAVKRKMTSIGWGQKRKFEMHPKQPGTENGNKKPEL
jgi:hypothetical protein